MYKIPIFIIVRDRLTVLQDSLGSYVSQIRTPIEIVLHDNSSTYEPMLDFQEELERNEDCTIYRTQENSLAALTKTITHHMKSSDSPYYVVTDPDIMLDNVPGDILEFYIHLLTKYKVKVVGPMLRIDDLPNHYPLKKRARRSHIRQFWGKEPLCTSWYGHEYHYQYAPIDSTFGIYRKGTKWKNFNQGIRTYAPYIAKHLDWYLDPNKLTKDQQYYAEHTSKTINHWSQLC